MDESAGRRKALPILKPGASRMEMLLHIEQLTDMAHGICSLCGEKPTEGCEGGIRQVEHGRHVVCEQRREYGTPETEDVSYLNKEADLKAAV